MERRGDQRAVASGIGEPGEIVQPAHTSPSQQHQPWRGIPHTRDQPKVEPRAGANTGQVYHDQRADAGVRGVRGVRGDRLAGNSAPTTRRARSDDRLSVAQIEAEGDARAAGGLADLSEGVI